MGKKYVKLSEVYIPVHVKLVEDEGKKALIVSYRSKQEKASFSHPVEISSLRDLEVLEGYGAKVEVENDNEAVVKINAAGIVEALRRFGMRAYDAYMRFGLDQHPLVKKAVESPFARGDVHLYRINRYVNEALAKKAKELRDIGSAYAVAAKAFKEFLEKDKAAKLVADELYKRGAVLAVMEVKGKYVAIFGYPGKIRKIAEDYVPKDEKDRDKNEEGFVDVLYLHPKTGRLVKESIGLGGEARGVYDYFSNQALYQPLIGKKVSGISIEDAMRQIKREEGTYNPEETDRTIEELLMRKEYSGNAE